mgnify:CR=1 FL=1
MRIEIDINDKIYELLTEHMKHYPKMTLSDEINMAVADHLLEEEEELSKEEVEFLVNMGSWE